MTLCVTCKSRRDWKRRLFTARKSAARSRRQAPGFAANGLTQRDSQSCTKRWSRTARFVPDCWLVPRHRRKPQEKEEQKNEKSSHSDCPPDRCRQHRVGMGRVSDGSNTRVAAVQLCSVRSASVPAGERFLRAAWGLEQITAETGVAEQQQLGGLFPFPAAPALDRCREAFRWARRSSRRYELRV